MKRLVKLYDETDNLVYKWENVNIDSRRAYTYLRDKDWLPIEFLPWAWDYFKIEGSRILIFFQNGHYLLIFA